MLLLAALLMLPGPMLSGLMFSGSALEKRPTPVFANVYIGSQGPYRFLVDTGAETSLVDQRLAAELGLHPQYRVEVVTQHRVQAMPALKSNVLRAEGRPLPDVELVWHDLAGARLLGRDVKGVLGLNALRDVPFLLRPGDGEIEFAAKRPEGLTLPFENIEGRMAVEATMGDERLKLLLDSGSTHVVLFRIPAAMTSVTPVKATYATVEAARQTVPTCWTAEMRLGGEMRIRTQPAAMVSRPGSVADGLLPVSLFRSVYVDAKRGEVVLSR